MTRVILAVLAFVAVTFGVQGTSHFVLNTEHYAAVGHLRTEAIFVLGFLAMLVQVGILLSIYTRSPWARKNLGSTVAFSLSFGLFLASYIAFAESAKYTVPDIPAWVTVELTASMIQFGLYGILLWLIYRGAQAVDGG